MVDTMVADDLATQGAKTSVAMVSTQFPLLVMEVLKDNLWSVAMVTA